MESPHPSYPPLEMASSGCITVANNYCSKDMSLRSDNIIALDDVSPRTVSEAVSQALARAPIGRTCAFDQIRPIPTSVPVFDAQAVADRICNAVPRGAAEKDPGPAPAPEASVSSPAQ
jgi:hypothetical protein